MPVIRQRRIPGTPPTESSCTKGLMDLRLGNVASERLGRAKRKKDHPHYGFIIISLRFRAW